MTAVVLHQTIGLEYARHCREHLDNLAFDAQPGTIIQQSAHTAT